MRKVLCLSRTNLTAHGFPLCHDHRGSRDPAAGLAVSDCHNVCGGCACERSGLAVAGEPTVLQNHFLCCLSNLHAAFWTGNPAQKLTRSVAVRLLVSFFRVSASLEVVSRGTHPIVHKGNSNLIDEDLVCGTFLLVLKVD